MKYLAALSALAYVILLILFMNEVTRSLPYMLVCTGINVVILYYLLSEKE